MMNQNKNKWLYFALMAIVAVLVVAGVRYLMLKPKVASVHDQATTMMESNSRTNQQNQSDGSNVIPQNLPREANTHLTPKTMPSSAVLDRENQLMQQRQRLSLNDLIENQQKIKSLTQTEPSYAYAIWEALSTCQSLSRTLNNRQDESDYLNSRLTANECQTRKAQYTYWDQMPDFYGCLVSHGSEIDKKQYASRCEKATLAFPNSEKLMDLAARQGYPLAQLDYELSLPRDKDVPPKDNPDMKDKVNNSLKYIELSIRQGMVEGLNRLSGIYDEGQLVERDPIKSYAYMAAYAQFRKPAIRLQEYDSMMEIASGDLRAPEIEQGKKLAIQIVERGLPHFELIK